MSLEVFTNAAGELLADYLKDRWHDAQEPMKRLFGGEPSDALEGHMVIDVGFYENGMVDWYRAEGAAEDVLEGLRHLAGVAVLGGLAFTAQLEAERMRGADPNASGEG